MTVVAFYHLRYVFCGDGLWTAGQDFFGLRVLLMRSLVFHGAFTARGLLPRDRGFAVRINFVFDGLVSIRMGIWVGPLFVYRGVLLMKTFLLVFPF